jgi:GNAT superfamily N-acetyltransferase
MITGANIRWAREDDEIHRCFAVMKELRTDLAETEFIALVRRMEQGGFRMVYVEHGDAVKAVAGFRIMESLANGKFLYVDDLVTDSPERSRGYGQLLFDWLVDHARSNGCRALTLDSAVHRFDAHRFYLRNRMAISSHHFFLKVGNPD